MGNSRKNMMFNLLLIVVAQKNIKRQWFNATKIVPFLGEALFLF